MLLLVLLTHQAAEGPSLLGYRATLEDGSARGPIKVEPTSHPMVEGWLGGG
jgi:hypothetical protein